MRKWGRLIDDAENKMTITMQSEQDCEKMGTGVARSSIYSGRNLFSTFHILARTM